MSLREDVGNIYKSCLNKLDPADTVYAYLKSNSDLFDNHKRVYLIAFGKASTKCTIKLFSFLVSTIAMLSVEFSITPISPT